MGDTHVTVCAHREVTSYCGRYNDNSSSDNCNVQDLLTTGYALDVAKHLCVDSSRARDGSREGRDGNDLHAVSFIGIA